MYVSDEYEYKGYWSKGMLGSELFDVLSLLRHLSNTLSYAKFEKALVLLKMSEEDFDQLVPLLDHAVLRQSHSSTPLGRWSKQRVLVTFTWVNENRTDGLRLAVETLDLARIIRATPANMLEAGKSSTRYNYMDWTDWHILMDSGATTFGIENEEVMYPSLVQKHVRGDRDKKTPKT